MTVSRNYKAIFIQIQSKLKGPTYPCDALRRSLYVTRRSAAPPGICEPVLTFVLDGSVSSSLMTAVSAEERSCDTAVILRTSVASENLALSFGTFETRLSLILLMVHKHIRCGSDFRKV